MTHIPLSAFALLLALPPSGAHRPAPATVALTRHITVPIDRADPARGSATLTIDLGAPFDPQKPTVLVVEDGQQFYIRTGAMAALQRDLLGPAVNVAGLIPRGSDSTFIAATRGPRGETDWRAAWRIFNSSEWVEDLEAARRALVGAAGRVDLYGRSGGSYLVHQYLAAHAAHVRRAFTQSAVDPSLNRELGIPLDDYVAQLTRTDTALWRTLEHALPVAGGPGDARLRALLALQRQHFYVPADSFPQAQRALIAALAAHDSAAIRRLETAYEVDDIMHLETSPQAIPQDVRVLELLYPSGAFQAAARGGIYPLIESQATFIRPLLDLVGRGAIAVRPRDARAAHRCSAQVFVLAARDDEAVDYRTSIALASEYPSHTLFIAQDNHVFEAMDRLGARRALVQAFFGDGPASPAFARALDAADAVRWHGAP